jgi:hypothetical protein
MAPLEEALIVYESFVSSRSVVAPDNLALNRPMQRVERLI